MAALRRLQMHLMVTQVNRGILNGLRRFKPRLMQCLRDACIREGALAMARATCTSPVLPKQSFFV